MNQQKNCVRCDLEIGNGIIHDCTMVMALQRKLNAALSEIQRAYREEIEYLNIKKLNKRVVELEKLERLHSSVNQENHHSLFKRIELIEQWTRNCAEHINMQPESISFNPLKFDPNSIMGALVGKETCKHSSQKHLEKCLKERNEKIKELENKLEFTAGALEGNNERIDSLNDRNMHQGNSINEMSQRIEKLEQQLAEKNAEFQQALNKANMQEQIANQWQLEYNASSQRIERRNNELHAYAAANKSLQSVIKAREEELATLKQRSFGNSFPGNNCT